MDAEEPTIDNLIIALPLAEKVPVVALKSLLTERERLDEFQEVELQKIHKKYAEKIKPYLARVRSFPFRSRNSSREKTRCLKKSQSWPTISRRARKPHS